MVIVVPSEMTTLATQRQQFAQQANENTMVKKVRPSTEGRRLHAV